MKGLKKLALASAVLAVSTGAFAMEALEDEALSATTGQAGLTITMAPNVTVDHLRYRDTDGLSAAQVTSWGGATGLGNGYTNAGVLDISALHLDVGATGSIKTILDVASNGTTGADTTSLFVETQITGLNVSIGSITLDNGSLLAAGANSKSFGAIGLADIDLGTGTKMRITPGGAIGTQGVTIAMQGAQNISLDFGYGDDAALTGVGCTATATGGCLSLGVAGDATDQGIRIVNMQTGAITIDANNTGLVIGTGAVNIDSVQLGATSGIQINGTSIGEVALVGVHMAGGTITVAGH